MNEQEKMFEVDSIPKKSTKFTNNAMKAINWYAQNYNLKVELSTPPNVRFTSKELGETHSILLGDVIDEYRAFRKDELKTQARERALAKKRAI